jgi:uncharacterized protein (TIGR02099 family)
MPPLTPDAAAAALPRWARKAAAIAIGLVVGAWSLLLIAWLTLYWGILPQVSQWRPEVEARASATLGVPVLIGGIEVRSRGWVPTLELSNVVMHDSAGREALRLPRVVAALSARSLVALQPRLEQLYIDGASLDVRRGQDGRLRVAGIELGGRGAPSDAADWAFEQHELVIRNGSLRWTDELRGAPTLVLEQVDAVLRNGLRHHELRLDATPPAEWGARFSLRGRFAQPLFARAGDWRRWHGQMHADLPRADVRELRRHVALPVELSQGDGALRAWIDVSDGRAQAATVDVALADVSMRLAPDLQPLDFAQLQGRVSGARDAQGLRMEARRFGFVTGSGVEWPLGDFSLSLRWPEMEGMVLGGDFRSDRLDLALMAQVAARLPVGVPVRSMLERLSPQGVVQGLSLRWDGPVEAPRHYQARGRAVALGIAAAASASGGIGRPGLHNATLDFQADERGGDARVTLDGGALEFPGVFADPVVALERFSAQLAWRVERMPDAPPTVELRVSNARFANADGQGELGAVWRTGASGTARLPGVLDMTGKLAQARAAATARYIPLGIPASVRDYVQQAVQDGRIAAADFKVKGALSDFPFAARAGAAGDGVFRIVGRAEDVTLHYVPEDADGAAWPAFTSVSGELVFDRTAMQIRNARGRLWGVELSQVSGGIRDLVNRPTLDIEGTARGPLSDIVRYVNATPLAAWTGQALRQASGAGPGELRLSLSLPLHDIERSTVSGSLMLPGNELRVRPDLPPLAQAKGRVDFTRQSITVVGASARVLGGEARFEGGTAPDGSLRLTARGTATAEALQRAPELGALSRAARRLSGQAPYRLQLAVRDGHPEFIFASGLEGLSSDLPAPLGKRADATLPVRVEVASAPGGSRDELRLDVGTLVQARFTRDTSGPSARVLQGGIGVGEAPPEPSAGVHANVNVPRFDADAWSELLGQWSHGADAGAAAEGYLPRTIAFRAGELIAGGRRMTGIVAGITRAADDATWRANVAADQLAGYLEMQPARAAGQPGRVFARLGRLSLPQQHAESVESLLDAAPATAPALDIVVDDFELRGKKLGRVEVEAANRLVAGGGREWHLSKLAVILPEARLSGSGQWGGPRRRMVLDFQMDMTDSAALVERLGGGRTLKGGRGRLYGQVSWAGSPLSPNLPSLAGQMNLALEAGQFLKAGPGAGRLLSVLSLQSLPRRLVLDFRDVFQEGFAFDSVTGDIAVSDGVARTNNFRMRGLQAAVLMEGSADLDRETQDLRVLVVPEINAGTASLAYAAINPAIGLGTFVAQLLLRRPLMAAGTREFHVTGTWADPKVDRVERAPGAPLPDIDPVLPAAAASSPPRTP